MGVRRVAPDPRDTLSVAIFNVSVAMAQGTAAKAHEHCVRLSMSLLPRILPVCNSSSIAATATSEISSGKGKSQWNRFLRSNIAVYGNEEMDFLGVTGTCLAPRQTVSVAGPRTAGFSHASRRKLKIGDETHDFFFFFLRKPFTFLQLLLSW